MNDLLWTVAKKAIGDFRMFLSSGGTWRDLFIVCSFIALYFLYERVAAHVQRRRAIKQGSVSYQAKKFTTEKIGRRQLLFRAGYDAVRYPTLVSLFTAAAVIPVVFIAEWLIKFTFVGHAPVVCDDVEFFSTLWQVQAGLSAAALPILIFIIELSKDQNNLATRSSQVLIRETWIFPIIVVALTSVSKVGIDLYVNRKGECIGFANVLLFVLVTFLTVFAYYQALRLMFNPAQLKTKSIDVMKDKIAESVTYSAQTRIGNTWMIKSLQEWSIGWYPFSPRRDQRDRFYIIESKQLGRIMDINIERFRAFKESLDWRTMGPGPRIFRNQELDNPEEDSGTDRRKDKEFIFIAKRFRELVRDRDRALILIEKAALNSFNPEEADSWIKTIFQIEP